MLSNAADYDFVTGITNEEVMINGQIMPWRDVNYLSSSMPPTAAPRCLRGEDVCWLWEAVNARMAIRYAITDYNSSTTMWNYSPSISKMQFAQINNTLRNTYIPSPYGCWLSSLSSIVTPADVPNSTETYMTFDDCVKGSHLNPTYWGQSPNVNWYSAHGLSSDQMRNQFYNLGLTQCLMYYRMWRVGDSSQSYNTSWTSSYVNGGVGAVQTPVVITDHRCLLGETLTMEDGSNHTYYETAIKQQISGLALIGDPALRANITKYIDGISCLVSLHDEYSNNYASYYGSAHNHRNYILPVEVMDDNNLCIMPQTLLSIALDYKQHFGIKFFVDGEMELPQYSGIGKKTSSCRIVITTTYPIIKVSKDLDVVDLQWDWTPS